MHKGCTGVYRGEVHKQCRRPKGVARGWSWALGMGCQGTSLKPDFADEPLLRLLGGIPWFRMAILLLPVRHRSVLSCGMANEEFAANPQQVLAEAVQEPRRRGLADYQDAIRVLKEEKEFSFRDIAVWLQQRGLKVDHNAVWRAYSKTAPRGGRRANQRREQGGGSRPTRKPCPGWKEFNPSNESDQVDSAGPPTGVAGSERPVSRRAGCAGAGEGGGGVPFRCALSGGQVGGAPAAADAGA